MQSLKEKSISTVHGKTYYWTNEKKECITLVFLPGLTADHTLFEKQTAAFEDAYNIIVWDCPGHGKSRPYDDFTYPNVTGTLKEILDSEKVDKAVFIGQSLGGMLAQFFIHNNPGMASGFVSIDSAPFGSYYSKSDFFWLNQLEWMCRMFPDASLRSAMAKGCGKTEYAQKKMLDMLSDYSKKELCHLIYLGEAAFIPVNESINLPCPVVLILGDCDRLGKVASYNKSWAEKEHYPLHIVEGAAHNSNEDNPEEVNTIIRDFLKTII